MSRGQNSFSIEVEEEEEERQAKVQQEVLIDVPLHDISVCLASADELNAHEALLLGLDKDVRGKSIWHQM